LKEFQNFYVLRWGVLVPIQGDAFWLEGSTTGYLVC
jgi:hypothetical protein